VSLLRENIVFYLINLLVFVIPINQKLASILVICLGFFWLTEPNLKQRIGNIVKDKFTILFISFYLLHIVGYFYSANKTYGRFDLEVKLLFLLVPLMFSSFGKLTSIVTNRVSLIKSFVLGNFLALVFNLGSAYYRYDITDNIGHFFYVHFSTLLHPSYFSLYLNFCVLSLLYFIHYKRDFIVRIVALFLLILCSTGIILTNSKAGMLILLLIVLSFLIISLKKGKAKKLMLFILILFSSITYFSFENKFAVGRFNEMIESITDKDSTKESSSSVRLIVWSIAIEEICKNPVFGVGNGDANDMLLERYKEKELNRAIRHEYNAHNQYLQTTLSIGIVGLLLLVMMFAIPLWKCYLKRDWLYLSFILLVAVNLLFEAMFERQAGILFYCIFNSIFYYSLNSKNKISIINDKV
jgi:O-antigen ligase